jgi:hypothetical protein
LSTAASEWQALVQPAKVLGRWFLKEEIAQVAMAWERYDSGNLSWSIYRQVGSTILRPIDFVN